MSEGPILQDPGETLDHSLDWSSWLLEPDGIDTSVWAITPEGPTLADEMINGTMTTVFVSGLTLGQVYVLTNSITTDAGREGVDSIVIRCFPK